MGFPVGFSRFILFFQGPEGEGWSEEYLVNEELATNDFSDAVSATASARAALLSENFVLSYVRMNHPHEPRTLLPYNGDFEIPHKGTNALSDYQRLEVGALVTMTTDSGRYASRIFRGVPDEAIDTDGKLNSMHTWYTSLETFLATLTASPPAGLINVRATSTLAPYTFAAYTGYLIRESAKRDTGRPFGLRRGRTLTR